MSGNAETSMLAALRQCVELLPAPNRRLWLLCIPLAAVAAGLEAAAAGGVFGLVSVLTGGDARHVPVLGKAWALVSANGTPSVAAMAVFLAALYVVKNLVLVLQVWLLSRATNDASVALSRRLLRGFLHMPLSAHLERTSADIIHQATEAVDIAVRQFLSPLTMAASEVLVLAVIALVLVLASPGAALAVVIAFALILFLVMRLVRHWLLIWGSHEQHRRAEMLYILQQAFEGLREVKLRGGERFFEERFASRHRILVRARHRSGTLNQASRLIVETAFVVGTLITVIVIDHVYGATSVVLPLLGVYAYAGFRVIPSMNRIFQYTGIARYGQPSVARMAADLRSVEAIQEGVASSGASAVIELTRAISFEDVSHVYPQASLAALSGINLTIERGQSIAIVGPTGSGKSTLINILLGFVEPTSGRVSVDGVDIRRGLRSWRGKLGYVPQLVFLLDDSLRRNIAFAQADQDIDEERVRRAVHAAQLDEVIAALPKGLDSVVGERGARLSGGERQRVAIARALYPDPEVVVFDEATSALDSETERELTRAIDTLRGYKTIVIITHRMNTAKRCNRIVVLDRGRIHGVGTYEELLAGNAVFQRLAERKSEE